MKKHLIIFFVCVMVMLAAACGRQLPPPMELISKDAAAYADSECRYGKPASTVNDGAYMNAWRSCGPPSAKKPAWVALDLSKAAPEKKEKVLLVWYNEDTSPYDHTLITAIQDPGRNIPGAYTVDVNSAPGGKPPKDGWITVATVGRNTYHSRQHVFGMKGMNWVRLSAIGSDGSKGNDGVSFNLDVYDASKGTDDNWIFLGDSITQMSMHHDPFRCALGTGIFSDMIRTRHKERFPVQENGGTGYMKSSDGAKHINEWLAVFPGKYVALSYGTNDAWSKMPPEEFYTNYKIMVEAVLKAGKVPLVPTIPWSSKIEEIQSHGAALNDRIKRIYREYPRVIKGPDFREMYKKQPGLLSGDGVHPAWPEGLYAYRKAWADLALEKIYN